MPTSKVFRPFYAFLATALAAGVGASAFRDYQTSAPNEASTAQARALATMVGDGKITDKEADRIIQVIDSISTADQRASA